jgi:hypothetical protein
LSLQRTYSDVQNTDVNLPTKPVNISILVLLGVQCGVQIAAFRLFGIAEDLLTLKMAVVFSSEMLDASPLDSAAFHPRMLQFVVLMSAS